MKQVVLKEAHLKNQDQQNQFANFGTYGLSSSHLLRRASPITVYWGICCKKKKRFTQQLGKKKPVFRKISLNTEMCIV